MQCYNSRVFHRRIFGCTRYAILTLFFTIGEPSQCHLSFYGAELICRRCSVNAEFSHRLCMSTCRIRGCRNHDAKNVCTTTIGRVPVSSILTFSPLNILPPPLLQHRTRHFDILPPHLQQFTLGLQCRVDSGCIVIGIAMSDRCNDFWVLY